MSDEYTPTDEIVRAAVGYYAAKAGDVMGEAAFDRWLATHDAQVRADALEEAASVADGMSVLGAEFPQPNMLHAVIAWNGVVGHLRDELRARAASIRETEQ